MTSQEFKSLRLRLGLTQVQFAHLFGKGRASIVAYEHGQPLSSGVDNFASVLADLDPEYVHEVVRAVEAIKAALV